MFDEIDHQSPGKIKLVCILNDEVCVCLWQDTFSVNETRNTGKALYESDLWWSYFWL